MNVAELNISGLNAPTFPIASGDPGSKSLPASPVPELNAFLAMFSAAGETDTPEISITSHVPAETGASPVPKERAKEKDASVIPAAADRTMNHAATQQVAPVAPVSNGLMPGAAVLTTVFAVRPSLPISDGSGLQAVQSAFGKDPAQLPGWTAQSNVVASRSIQPAQAFAASGSDGALRIEAPIAFALQLRAKAEPPASQQSVEVHEPQFAASALAAENPLIGQPAATATPLALPQFANVMPELKPQSTPDAPVVVSAPVPAGSPTATRPGPAIPASKSQPDARSLEKPVVPPTLPSSDGASGEPSNRGTAESGGNGFSWETRTSSRVPLQGENPLHAAEGGPLLLDHQVTPESGAVTMAPAAGQPVKSLGVKTSAFEKDQEIAGSVSSKSPIEARGQRSGYGPEPTSKGGRSAACAPDLEQNTESQTKSQDTVTKAQPASKIQAKDSRENPGYGGSISDRGGQDEMLHVSGAMPQQENETFAARASGEQHSALPSVREFSPETVATSAVRPAVARGISLQLEGAPGVAVQVNERGGKIDIAVRSADTQLSRSLQSGLGDLVAQLENRGFKTDAWTPGAPGGAASVHGASELPSNLHHSGHSGAGTSQQEHQGDSNQRRRPPAREAFGQTLAEEDARTE